MQITDAALEKVKEVMENNGGGFAGILISFEGGYRLDLVKEGDENQYTKIENDSIGVFALQEHVSRAERANVEFVSDGPTSGFTVTRDMPESDSSLMSQIQEIIDTEINPAVASHGGSINLLDVEEKRVFIQMGGGCAGCGMADVTLKTGVLSRLQQLDPDIEVVDTTDHASGENPYYTPSKK